MIGILGGNPAEAHTKGRARLVYAAELAAVGGFYYGAARLGLALSVAHGVITPVWAPTGIALAALVLVGRRMWPAVLVAAFVANATHGTSVPVALLISIGNTAEAVIGRELLSRARFRPAMERVRDVLVFIVLAAALSTAVSATNGVTTLWVGHDLTSSYGSSWLLWWVGDSMGDLVVGSFLLVVAAASLRKILPRPRIPEAVALLALVVGLSAFVFLAGYWRYPHVLFPVYIWAALRFGQLGAVSTSFAVAAVAIAGAVGGETPIGHESGTHVVLILEALLAAITISVLLLGAVLAERGEAERELAEAQELARVGSWSWDIDSGRIAWSDELYRLFDLEPGTREFDFEGYLELLHPADRELTRRVVEKAYATGEPFSFQHRVLLPNGMTRWLLGRGRVIADTGGKPTRMVGTAQDVTERRQIDQLRDTILAAVSHELRTPLTAIVGFAVTMKERALDSEQRATALDTLLEQAHKLERLLGDLLDLDRLRHGFVRPAVVDTDIARLVEQVAAAHANGTHPIQLHTEAAPASVDAAKVERMVDNLIANAIRHTPAGTAVEVRVEPLEDGVIIAVDDSGPGVASDERETIFEPFRRGADVGVAAGTGVGLSLVAQFAALHGGRVWVEDSPTGGASFRVYLPR